MGRHGKVLFDGIEVGRIRAGLPMATNPTNGMSYAISSAAYGTQFPPLIHSPQPSLTALPQLTLSSLL